MLKKSLSGEALDKYIEDRSAVLSPRTVMDYKRIRKNEIQSLMPVQISEITQDMIQRIVNEERQKALAKNSAKYSWAYQCRPEGGATGICIKYKAATEKRPNLYVPD